MKSKEQISSDCLAASLTILIKLGVLTQKDILKKLDDESYEGLFDLLNEKYKEIVNQQRLLTDKGVEKVKKGTIHQSRKQSNFVNRMTPEKREQHIKEWIATCNWQELIPFVQITKHDKYYREIEYEIRVPDMEQE